MQSDEAIEAMRLALCDSENVAGSNTLSRLLVEYLGNRGITLRRETMTEAELEREAKKAAVVLDYPALNVHRGEWLHILDAVKLAKKFRG